MHTDYPNVGVNFKLINESTFIDLSNVYLLQLLEPFFLYFLLYLLGLNVESSFLCVLRGLYGINQ